MVPLAAYHTVMCIGTFIFIIVIILYAPRIGKVVLNRTEDSVNVILVEKEVMTFTIDASSPSSENIFAAPGFVILQTHSQLHRIRASPQLQSLLQKPSHSANVRVSRSTGIVVPIGQRYGDEQFDYFAAMFSAVKSRAQVRAVFYSTAGKSV